MHARAQAAGGARRGARVAGASERDGIAAADGRATSGEGDHARRRCTGNCCRERDAGANERRIRRAAEHRLRWILRQPECGEMTCFVRCIYRTVRHDQALPVRAAVARRAPQQCARDRIQRIYGAAADEEHHTVDDDRRGSAQAVLPLRRQRGVATRVEIQPQARCATAVHDKDPCAAVGGIHPHGGLAQHLAALRHADDRSHFAADVARSTTTTQILQIEQA